MVPFLREVPVNRGNESTGYYMGDCKSIRRVETAFSGYKCGQILAGDMSGKEAQGSVWILVA